jgi:GTP 3',8-cyclase
MLFIIYIINTINIYNMSKIFNPHNKILCHLGKVEKLLNNENPAPILIEIDPSNACNHSCPFCISGHLHLNKYKGTDLFNRTMLKKDVFKDLVDDLISLKINAINWTGGGEPTMNPALGEMIKYINKNSNIKMGMFSNGTMFKRFDLFETIVNSCSWVRVSIDAGREDTYDNLRITNNKTNFKTVIENINTLIETKKRLKSDITIGVGFVVTRDNYNEILDFVNLFKDIDVDYCQFKPEIIQVERDETLDKSKEQISSDFWLKDVLVLLDEAKKILGDKYECNAYKIDDLIVDIKNYGRNYKQCLGSQLQPCVGADGNVYVCTNHRGHKKYSYGNLYEKSFKEIWSDIKTKSNIMNKIENEEKFINCTHLCKPHESNKILYQIKKNIENPSYLKNLKEKTKDIVKIVKHVDFI